MTRTIESHHERNQYITVRPEPVEGLDQSFLKAILPLNQRISKRFHKPILQEFYQVTFCEKRYRNLESSQMEMDRHLIIIMKVLIKANQQW